MIPLLTDQEIVAARSDKHSVDPRRPYAYLHEPECDPAGSIIGTSTIFLTNRECPFRCLMCDLWKNTTDRSVSPGDIPEQIRFALDQLPEAQQIKLYNSGNFFDTKAIPKSDHQQIASLVSSFGRVIVENHPRLCNTDCVAFRDLLAGKLEVAMGLETVHPDVLRRLNKRMTLHDFERATEFLLKNDIDIRAFILLRPPYMSEDEGVDWAIKSLEFAFAIGVQCCAIVPTRAGNGMVDRLENEGYFEMPSLSSIECVLNAGLSMNKGRVFMDLWDLERFYDCSACGSTRKARLHQMNLTQQVLPAISCSCSSSLR